MLDMCPIESVTNPCLTCVGHGTWPKLACSSFLGRVRHFGYWIHLGDLLGWYVSVCIDVPTHGTLGHVRT